MSEPRFYNEEGEYYACDSEDTVKTSFSEYADTVNAIIREMGIAIRMGPLDVTWDQWKEIGHEAVRRIVAKKYLGE